MKNALLISFLLIAYSGFAQIICPDDITINCDQDYTDTLVIGSPIIPDSIDVEDVSIDFTPDLNACNDGTVLVAYSLDSSVVCTQTVTVVNPFSELDSNTIVFPMDTTYITCYRPFEEPTWIAADCDFIGYTESIDTITFTSEWEYSLERTLTVIDWCLYDETNGSEGLYSGSHIISLIDETPPIALCFSFLSYFPSELPITIEAKNLNWASGADCASYSDLRFTFSDIPPELDPNFDSSINTSIREIQLDEFDGNTLWVDMYVWDPSGNFSFCSMPIYLNPECPSDLTLNCDQDYTDLSLTGEAVINSNSEFDSITSVIYTPNLDACGVGTVLIEHQAEGTILCTQTIIIVNPFPPFEPTSIIMPNDTVYTDCALWEAEPPTWTGGPCDFIGYTEDLDTFDFIHESSFKLLREITVIDWCLYDQTDGAEGLYYGSQEIEVKDEKAPTPFCVSLWNLGDSQFPHTIEAEMFDIGAFDFCTPKELFRYTFSEVAPEDDPDYNPTTRTSSRTFNLEDFDNGTINVDIYHWDLAGNSEYCRIIFYVTEDCLDQEHPLVDTRNQWNVTTISGPNYNTAKQRFKSEEISLQGKKYLQIETAEEENSNNWTDYPLYMRECNGKLFGRELDTGTKLYFDFNLEQGDTLFSEQYIGEADLRIDSVYNKEYLDGSIRKTLYVEALNGFGYFEMIEGIGSTIFPLTEYHNIAFIDYSKTLGCFTTNDDIVYIGSSFSSCWPVGIEDQLDDDAVDIYPNPGNSSFNIQTKSESHIIVNSLDGSNIYNFKLKQGFNKIQTDNWKTGLYFITITTSEGSITKRWMKI